MVEYPEYSEYVEYKNYTASEEEYDDYYEYSLDISETPSIVDCTCFQTDSKHEFQYRKKQVIKEGTIGGVPCGTLKETRSCRCLNYGMHFVKMM